MYNSSYVTEDDLDNLSIKYENIYSIDGELYFLTTNKNEILPIVNKWTNQCPWRPRIKFFDNDIEIENYINSFQNKKIIELSILCDVLWYGNIGHGLWDGIYPSYLALVKFGYQNSPYTLLINNAENKPMAYHIIVKLSENEPLEYTKLDKTKLIHFKTLVAGTGNVGNRVVNEEYKLYGKKYSGLELFKERILKSHNIEVNKPINDIPKIIIINNKRFSEYELDVIQKVINNLKSTYNIKFIDWYRNYKSFTEQLKELEDTDIHISGPGTGMLYMPFLKKGAVNINLGNMERTQTNSGRPNLIIKNTNKEDFILPGYIEQNVCNAADYINTIYYDRYKYNNLEFEPLINIINCAVNLLKKKELLYNNLNIDALIFKEYCKRVNNAKQICNHMTNIALCIEFLVNEHPAVIESNLIDIELLRKIKDEFNYDRRYEIKL